LLTTDKYLSFLKQNATPLVWGCALAVSQSLVLFHCAIM